VIEANLITNYATIAAGAAKPRYNLRQRAQALIWHKRLGYPRLSALKHLVQQSKGVKITRVLTVDCNACGRAKAKRLIRRTPRRIDKALGERVLLNFHNYKADSLTKEKS
jgi:hypothetical protein